MRWSVVDDASTRTYVVVADAGDEAVGTLSAFATDQDLSAAQVTAVGAFARATVGWFDLDRQDYRRIEVDQQCEVLSLVGDVALSDGDPTVHAHVVLGLSDGTVRGGHLLAATVRPTLEVVLREAPAQLHKTMRPEFGLALIDPELTTGR